MRPDSPDAMFGRRSQLTMPALDDSSLRNFAGDGAFKRGQVYFREGRVLLHRSTEAGVDAEVDGSETYRVRLRREGAEWNWHCTCPAAADGSFCKHLVAAALAWREGEREPAPKQDELLDFFAAQPAAQLAQWLRELADEDPDIEKRFELLAARHDPARLKKALGVMLTVRGFMDWRRNDEYARRLGVPLQLLTGLLVSDAEACREHCEYAIGRLLRVYERSDDSNGAVGERIRDFADLYARAAVRAGADGQALYKLKTKDDWGFFPLEAYWGSLGDRGQTVYGQRVEADYAKLAPARASRNDSTPWHTEFGPVSRMEELAHVRRDCDGLLRVLSRDLSSGFSYEKIVLACRDFKRDREALQWAERGVKAHGDVPRLRVLCAEELTRAGLIDEATEMLWQDLKREMTIEAWTRLKAAAGAGWSDYRHRALAQLQKQEGASKGVQRDVTRRIELLIHDGDYAAALQAAQSASAHPRTLIALAMKLEKMQPLEAATLLRRVVDFELPRADAKTYAEEVRRIASVAHLSPGAGTQTWIAGIKERYRARRKLMGLLSAAGL